MKKILKNNIHLLAVLIFTFFISTSCNRPKDVLTRSEMTEFLFDLHKLDGSLSAAGLGSSEDRENIYYYNALLEAHGITKAQFDSSLVWYSKDPKKFDKIYTDVLTQMNELKTEVDSRKFHPVDSTALRHVEAELWYDKTSYLITRDSSITQLDFDIIDNTLHWADKFIFGIHYRLSSTDTIQTKKLIIRLRYIEDITDSIIVPLTADSVLRLYKIRFRANRQLPIVGISGQLLSDTTDTTTASKFYAKIDSISLTRQYDGLAQDSIKTIIEQIMQNRQPQVVDSMKLKEPTKPKKVLSKKKLHEKVL